MGTLRLLLNLGCLAAAALFVATVASQTLAPDALVKSVTDDVISAVKQDPGIREGNTRKTLDLVRQKVLPHFDFTRMTALAMGAHWRKASSAQRENLVDEFRTLLVRTYSTALSKYRDQVIEVKPPRGQPTDSEVVVRSEVRQSGTPPLTIDYSMEKTPLGWKVFDVAVEGISLVTTYRDTFATEVRRAGIEGLIESLAARNRELAAKHG